MSKAVKITSLLRLINHPVCLPSSQESVTVKEISGDSFPFFSWSVLNIPDRCFCSCSAFGVGCFDNCHYACGCSPSFSHFSTSLSRSASCGVIRVILRFAVLLLPLRISSSTGWVTPGCLLKMLVTRPLVCSLVKALRQTTQQVWYCMIASAFELHFQ